jgi:hypothetical protein
MNTMKNYLQSAFCLSATAALLVSSSLKAQPWETFVSDVPGSSGDIGTDASGQSVYPVGRLIDENTGNSAGVVLELDRPTGDWVTLHAYAEPGLNYVHNRAFNQKTTGRNHWVVRRSTDGGVTWSIVDDLAPTKGNAEAVAIAEDADGRIVVCGLTGDAANSDMSWIVRRGQLVSHTSKQKGKTVTSWVWEWTNLDPGYQLVPGRDSRANAITIDARGDIYVSGRGIGADGAGRFIVRRLPAP